MIAKMWNFDSGTEYAASEVVEVSTCCETELELKAELLVN